MHRTGATVLRAPRARGQVAEQGQNFGQGDEGTHSGEVDAGARPDGAVLVCRLAEELAAFAGLGQLAIAGGQDLRAASFEFILGGEVADGAV